jgi:hypothetical protein
VGKTNGDKELDLVAKEGTFAFRTVTHNQSFQSMDRTSTIIQKHLNRSSHVHKLQFELLW